MKANHFLVSAGVSLALAFTLSCSGDDGADGLQGSQGVQGPQGETGAQGSQGISGTSCSAEDKGTHIEIKCGDETTLIEMAKIEWCGLTIPYNPATHFCNNEGEVKSLCNGQIYSSSEYCQNGTKKAYGYIGGVYKTVEIGEQVWMAENLNYDVPDNTTDVCSDNNSSNCTTYGRLYNWATAMDLPSSCNFSNCASQVQSKHQGICPNGWHIPSNEDWNKLCRYVDGTTGTSSPYHSLTAGRYLRAKTGWSICGPSGLGSFYSCEDTYGFSALPGGDGGSDGSFYNAGYYGHWWSSSEYEYGSEHAYNRFMSYRFEEFNGGGYIKTSLFSVRCVQD